MPAAQYRHYDCRIIDQIIYKGRRVIFLENDLLRVGVLLDKGADIFQFLHKPSDTDFLWRSPQGLIPPERFTPTIASASGSFLDSYHGGWQEIFPGGGPTNYRGAELGLHGEVTHLGWECDILEDTPESISVRVSVECIRTPFRLERIMRLNRGKPTLFIEETLTNLSNQDQDFMWGHHPAFGAPFLREGVRLFIPAARGEVHQPQFSTSGIFEPATTFDWPFIQSNGHTIDLSLVPGANAGYSDLIYLKRLSAGWYALLDPRTQIGFGLAWQKEIFPYLWFWLVYGKAPDFPWWDRVFCLALEPWTSIPNSLPKAIEMGTQFILKGGEKIQIALTATAITGKNTIQNIDLSGEVA